MITSLIEAYPLIITSAHDEYWSDVEFGAFERRIFQLGKNTAFFGANTAYCQVRYGDLNRPPSGVDQGRQLVCYKTGYDPLASRVADSHLLVTNNFRTGGRRPESQVLGGAYQNWFEPASAQRPNYAVARTDLPYFAGTGWKVGDSAADVVGYEWDNRDPDSDGRHLLAPGASPRIDPASGQGPVPGPRHGRRWRDRGGGGDLFRLVGRSQGVQRRQCPVGLGARKGRLRQRAVPEVQ